MVAKKKPAAKSAAKAKHVSLDVRKLRTVSNEEFVKIGHMILSQDIETLQKVAQQNDTNAFTAMVISVVRGVIDKGNMRDFEVLMDRLCGKVKQDLPPDPTDPLSGKRVQVIVRLPSNGREATIAI